MTTAAQTISTVTNTTDLPTQKVNHRTQAIIGAIGLSAIIILGAFLRFYQLGAYSIGNTYYAATVKSMLTSWHNFFYASFEPGGSVTVDKPPLGFWVQAVSAYFFGVNGFALALPQALAGTFSIAVLYHLVRKYFGIWAGLVAALVLAVTPITIATERNNTIDGLLVFVLLLAAWAFLKATETGKTRHLLLGAFLVGLGFNIKMLQAIMPLPAFYAVYFLGSRQPWWKRCLQLAAATVVLLVVSLAWVAAVDLTPADLRPYIGSSENNTVLELIIGHNGLSRLGLNDKGPGRADGPRTDGGPAMNAGQAPQAGSPPQDGPAPGSGQANQPSGGFVPSGGNPPPGGNQANPPQEALDACAALTEGEICTVNLRKGNTIDGTCNPFPQGELVCVPEGRGPQANANAPGGAPGAAINGQGQAGPRSTDGPGGPDGGPGQGNVNGSETGTAGALRLFQEPLVTEASWLLVLALLGIPLAALMIGWAWPLSGKHNSLILWAGWLLPAMAYFSFTTGLFHRYYLIMLGPALGALAGIAVWALAKLHARNAWVGWFIAAGMTGITLAFEIFVFRTYPDYAGWVAAIVILLWLSGIGILAFNKLFPTRKVALAIVLAALMVAPLAWSALTIINANPNVALPTAGVEASDQTRASMMTPNQELLNENGQAILAYTLANTTPDSYLLATNNARGAAPYILETGRAVLTFGGFSGSDDVVSLRALQAMIENGELRYILGTPQKQEIAQWMAQSCAVADVPGMTITQQTNQPSQRNAPGGPGRGGEQNEALYDCGS